MNLVNPGANTSLRKSPGASPHEVVSSGWRHRNILDVDDFSEGEIDLVMETTGAMVEILSREVKKVPTLHGKTIVNLFYEPSTRTRSSFELAAKNLTADVINIDTSKSSVMKGESLINSLNTIKALGAEVVVIRHSMAGAPYLAAQYVNTSIINAGDGSHAHPSQALLDLYTMKQHLGNIKGRKIVIIGDIMYSRVARSNIWCLSKAGALITLCAPPTLMAIGIEDFLEDNNLNNVRFEPDVNAALVEADVVMLLRLQSERQQSGLLPTLREYIKYYQLNIERLSLAKPGALVMHPGPMNEDIEISSEVAHSAQSVIDEQVTNGIAVRMALFYLVSGGKASHGT